MHHLRHQLQPLRLEIVALVHQHGAVLRIVVVTVICS
jgi:hypothetical protein